MNNPSKKYPVSRQFMARDLLLFSLPSAPTPATTWTRTNGNRIFTLRPGTVIDPLTGDQTERLPSGKIARIVLMWLCTAAVHAQSPEIEISTSLKGFMRDLGIAWDSKSAHLAVEQLRRILATSIDLHHIEELDSGRKKIHSYHVRIGAESSLSFAADGALDERESRLVLSQEFFDRVVKHFPVPTSKKTWRALVESTRSPLTLDMFLWLSWRLHTNERRAISSPVRITWAQLAEQFGSEGAEYKFRERVIKSLREIEAIDPHLTARVEVSSQRGRTAGHRGIVLMPANNEKGKDK